MGRRANDVPWQKLELKGVGSRHLDADGMDEFEDAQGSGDGHIGSKYAPGIRPMESGQDDGE